MSFLALTKRLLNDPTKGRPGLVLRVESDFDPTTGTVTEDITSVPTRGAIVDFELGQLDGTMIEFGDQMVIIPGDVEVKIDDFYIDGSDPDSEARRRIVQVKEIYEGEAGVAAKILQVR